MSTLFALQQGRHKKDLTWEVKLVYRVIVKPARLTPSGGTNHMQTDKLEVSVETKDSRPIRTHVHENKTFIESKENAIYQIRVKNKTGARIKAIIAVDSISIVTGKPISDKPDETGYILGPYEEQVFRGYRVDANQVAEFKFVKREASYATSKGEVANNGVISVRALAEKDDSAKKLKDLQKQFDKFKKQQEEKYILLPYPIYPIRPYCWEREYWPWREPLRPYFGDPIYTGGGNTCGTYSSTLSAAMAKGHESIRCCVQSDVGDSSILRAMNAGASEPTQDCAFASAGENPFSCGTSWGAALADKVVEVAFEVGELIAEIAIFYAPLEGLKMLGVDVFRSKQVAFPEPFKKAYAEPPAGWHSGAK